MEGCFFSTTYIPIMDLGRTAVGVLGLFQEVTNAHLWRRRNATLLRLNAPALPVQNMDLIWGSVAASVKSNQYDIPQLLLYSIDTTNHPEETATDASCSCVLEAFVGFESYIRDLSISTFDLNSSSGLAPLIRHANITA